ncbi:LON peptidase substrate-binding domain-containing protein [Archangium sp.]|uniref:LON peptidase substrate-binding domain-containing protein n=1 Tax=Archangium sp. TaxID=1872627 RepID=UPI00389A3647
MLGGQSSATAPVAIPPTLPVLPLRNSVMFPGAVVPLSVKRPSSLTLVQDAVRADGLFVLAAQKDMGDEDPKPIGLYPVATVARITQVKKAEDGALNLQVQGLARCRLTWFVQQTPYLTAQLELLPEVPGPFENLAAAAEELRGLARQLAQRPGVPPEADTLVTRIPNPGHLADLLAANLPLRVQDKQQALETLDLSERLALVKTFMRRELEGTPVEPAVPVPSDIPLPAIPPTLPVLPLRNSVLFPGGVLPLSVQRPSVLALVRDADAAGGLVVLAAQKDMGDAAPRPVDLYPVATVARITRLEASGDGAVSFQVQGLARCRLTWFVQQTPYLAAKLEILVTAHSAFEGVTEAAEELRSLARQFLRGPDYPPDAAEFISNIPHPEHLTDILAANLQAPVEERQRLLETLELSERMTLVRGFLEKHLGAPRPALRIVPKEE